MNEELEQLEKHLDEINKALEQAEVQKKDIEEELEGKKSKRKEKKLAKLNATIEELKERKIDAEAALICGGLVDKTEALNDKVASNEEITHEEITAIIDDLDKLNEAAKSVLRNIYHFTDEQFADLEGTVRTLNEKLEKLKELESVASNKKAKKIREKIKTIENLLKDIDQYKNIVKENEEIENQLLNLDLLSDEERYQTISDINNTSWDRYGEMKDIVLSNKARFTKIAKKFDTKEESEEKSNWFKRNWGKLTCGVVSVAMISTLAGIALHYKKENDKLLGADLDNIPSTGDTLDPNNTPNNNPNNTNTPSNNSNSNPNNTNTPNNNPSSNPNNTNTPSDNEEGIRSKEEQEKIAKELIDKGYNDYYAYLMAKNFDDETIEELLQFYRPEAEKYAVNSGFNLDYLEYYENITNKYNTMPDDSIDYVNRSTQILTTGYFTDADIDDIAEILYCIDNQMLFTAEGVSVTSPIGAELNGILSNYIFQTPVEGEAKKLDAFKYFAKEGTDLNKFFTKASNLYQDIINNPTSQAEKDKLMDFLTIYANSVNGVVTRPETLTSDDEFNENAIINTYYDFYIAFKAMVCPLEPLMSPTYNIAVMPVIPADATEAEKNVLIAQYELALAEQNLNEENFRKNNERALALCDLFNEAIETNPYCHENLQLN